MTDRNAATREAMKITVSFARREQMRTSQSIEATPSLLARLSRSPGQLCTTKMRSIAHSRRFIPLFERLEETKAWKALESEGGGEGEA